MRHCAPHAPPHTYTIPRLVAMPVAEFVGVECRAAPARKRTNQRALSAADQAAEQRTAARAHRYGQLIAVLLPEAAMPRRVIIISRPRATSVARPNRRTTIDDARGCGHAYDRRPGCGHAFTRGVKAVGETGAIIGRNILIVERHLLIGRRLRGIVTLIRRVCPRSSVRRIQ